MGLDTKQVSLFQQAIKTRCRTTPALRQGCEADSNTTERIFFDHGGVPAWAAYMVTKSALRSTRHSPEKAEQKHLLALLDDQSVEDRQASAAQLAAALEPDKARIEQWIKVARMREIKRSRRRQMTHSTGAEADRAEGDSGSRDPYQFRNIPTSRSPSSRPTSNEPTHQTSYSVSHSQHEEISHSPQQDVRRPCDRTSPSDINDEHIFVNASTTACDRLFPESLARAVSRLDHISVAAVSMTFPRQEDQKALLSINVTADSIQALAWELFEVRLETEARFWFACVGTTRVIPTPRLGLHCCRIQPIPNVFGEDLTDAICANPMYQQERQNGDKYTNCISMVIPSAVDDCAQICVSLHPREGTKVKDRLF